MTLIRCLLLIVLGGFFSACGGGSSAPPPPPTPPTANSAALTLDEDTDVTGNMTGVAGEGGSLTFSVQAQPTNGTLAISEASFTYTPNADFFGTDSFTFVAVESGRRSTPATITLNVSGINDDPVATASVASTDEDNTLNASVVGSDVDGDALTLTVTMQATNGVVTPGTGIAYTYEPAANYYGPDSFSFTINDGIIDSAPETVSIDVLPVNDAPVVNAIASTVTAGTPLSVDITGTDIENDSLTYMMTTSFTKTLVTSDPMTSGVLDLDPSYGTWGADQATYVANDGLDDSAPANIDLTIEVPATTPSLAVQSYDSNGGSASLLGVEEGAADKIYVIGNIFGDLDPMTNTNTGQQFIAVHGPDGTRTSEVYFGGQRLRDVATGFDNMRFIAAGQELDAASVRFVALDANDTIDVDTVQAIPYSLTRAYRGLTTVHVPGVGFYILGNDNWLTWIDYDGVLRSNTQIPNPPVTLVHNWVVDDVRVVDNTVYIAGGILECDDNGDDCFGGLGTTGFVLAADTSGTPLSVNTLTNFPEDAAILADGRVAAHLGETLYLYDLDGSVVWQRPIAGVEIGNVGVDAAGDIYWWVFDRDTSNSVAVRISETNDTIWQTEQSVPLQDYLWPNDLSVDQYGNMFLSFVDRFNAATARGQLFNMHFDYSGAHQWTESIEPSDLNPNTINARDTILTRNFRFVSIATDNINAGGVETDGYLFINTVSPSSP